MSVYKRPGKATYSYDFIVGGRRFSGDTRQTKKRDAERVEERERELAKTQAALTTAMHAEELNFGLAALRWYEEVAKHHANFETTLKTLEWLKLQIGESTPLTKITDSVIAALVARRRGDRVKRRLKTGKVREGNFVTAATVNRTCTQPLREIINRARKVWKVPVADVDFGKHMLREPKERVREASTEEETAILSQLGKGYDAAVRFAFLTGCRRMEILGLEWPHVDFFSRRFTVMGKGGKVRTIPMSQAIYDLLWEQKDHDPVKVFTYVAARTLKPRRLVKGERYPLTEAGLKTAMRRAVPNAGVENFRFHDTRHTAATRILRASNLRVAQRVLGHADIATTTKYAHAMDDDLRLALEKIATESPTRNPTHTAKNHAKILGRKKKTT